MDEHGKSVLDGGVGEIEVNSEGLFAGYWDDWSSIPRSGKRPSSACRTQRWAKPSWRSLFFKDGVTVSADELRRVAGEAIAAYKVPEKVHFVTELPRGLTGKVQRKNLKEWAAKK